MRKDPLKIKIIVAIVLVCAAALSFFTVGNTASSVEKNQGKIDKINVQIDNTLRLSASATAASVAVSAIPDDTATPIADKLADFAGYFLLILSILYAEKYLLTIIGFGVFKIIIPVFCIITAGLILANEYGIRKICLKIIAMSLALYFTIPVSVCISDMVTQTYNESVNAVIDSTEQFSDEASALTEANGDQSAIASILDQLSETVESLKNKAVTLMNDMIEKLAMQIFSSCLIPLLVLAVALWLAKIITGVDLMPAIKKRIPRGSSLRVKLLPRK